MAKFPSATVRMEPTPTTTGALEVSVANELIHSKLSRGDRYVDSPEKIERILDAVASALGRSG